MNPTQALEKLKAGNQRYVEASRNNTGLNTEFDLHNHTGSQTPFAIILGCSDSRVPAELVFNSGLGELFIVRVAGNIADPTQMGSIEFACQQFGSKLIVVLGHSRCGAVNATLGALTSPPQPISPNLASIVDRVAPAVLPLVQQDGTGDQSEIAAKAVRANVEYSVQNLTTRSDVLKSLVENEEVKIVGAEYSLDTGRVEFYDDIS